MDVFLDGRRIPARQIVDDQTSNPFHSLELDGDVSPHVGPGTHGVAIRMEGCSAKMYDFYDVLVSRI